MTEKKKLKIDVTNIELGEVTGTSYKPNVNHAICKSNKPTSAEMKCMISSNLGNLKLVTDISFPFSSLNLAGFTTELDFKLNNEYSVSSNVLSNSNSASLARTLQFDAKSHWKIYDNFIEDHEFSSTTISNKNSLEALIPPSSCFNLTIKDNINTVTLNYAASATMIAYQNGVPISGTELQFLANGITNSNSINNIQITTPISGSIAFNVVVSDFTELTPCD